MSPRIIGASPAYNQLIQLRETPYFQPSKLDNSGYPGILPSRTKVSGRVLGKRGTKVAICDLVSDTRIGDVWQDRASLCAKLDQIILRNRLTSTDVHIFNSISPANKVSPAVN